MRVFHHFEEVAASGAGPTLVAIGNYDGVHVGHRAVLAAARDQARRRDLSLAVLTFDPHPAEILRPGSVARLVETARKIDLLGEAGADLVLVQSFDRDLSEIDTDRFAREILVESLGCRVVSVGENFRFGRDRSGGVGALRSLGGRLGFEVVVEPIVRSAGAEISSTRIRDLLARGDVAGAEDLLGRPHEVSGTVGHGDGRGGSLGFPTANLERVEVLCPAPGIYAARCAVDGVDLEAAVYVGERPTFGSGFAVEAHLLDFSGDLYGRRLVLRFEERVRPDERFADAGALVARMEEDVREVRSILGGGRG